MTSNADAFSVRRSVPHRWFIKNDICLNRKQPLIKAQLILIKSITQKLDAAVFSTVLVFWNVYSILCFCLCWGDPSGVCVCVCALHCAKRGIHLVNALKVFSVCFSSSELLGARASETAKSDKREQEGSWWKGAGNQTKHGHRWRTEDTQFP